MILHSIISMSDIFYDFSGEDISKKSEEKCITDPYSYLQEDEYYKKYIKMRK